MKALIIGAGIGGLTTALKLNEIGIDVEVFDSVSLLKELGVGINLQPYATRELANLGLLESLQAAAVMTTNWEFRTPDGKLIFRDPRGYNAGYRYPQLSIHRGKLQAILLKKFKEKIGESKLHLSHHFKKFSQINDKVIAEFIDIKSGQNKETFTGDILIGADGIHSKVRQQLHSGEGEMKFEGIMMWRGAALMKPFADGATAFIAGTSAVQLVVYPISKANIEGMVLTNWVVEIEVPNNTKFLPENWNRQGQLADFKNYFSEWNLGILDINALFKNTERILEYPMVDRDPLPFWSQGRVTLLGDAAHPMYPRGGNGVSQAIVDASVLANKIKAHPDDIDSALKEYESERIPVTSQIVLNGRQATQTQLLALVEKNCENKCGDTHSCVEASILKNIVQTQKQQANATVEQVNT